jgi:hypothetical protein
MSGGLPRRALCGGRGGGRRRPAGVVRRDTRSRRTSQGARHCAPSVRRRTARRCSGARKRCSGAVGSHDDRSGAYELLVPSVRVAIGKRTRTPRSLVGAGEVRPALDAQVRLTSSRVAPAIGAAVRAWRGKRQAARGDDESQHCGVDRTREGEPAGHKCANSRRRQDVVHREHERLIQSSGRRARDQRPQAHEGGSFRGRSTSPQQARKHPRTRRGGKPEEPRGSRPSR